MRTKPEPRTTMPQLPQMPLSRLARAATSSCKQPMIQKRLCRSSKVAASRINAVYRANAAEGLPASSSEPLACGAYRSAEVPPSLCHQVGRGGLCGAPTGKFSSSTSARVRHNPSLKRSANSKPPGPRGATSFILHRAGLAPHCRRPLSSNVRPHNQPLPNLVLCLIRP